MKDKAEWRTWDLSGLEVTQLRFDFQFHVLMWTPDRELLLIFGAPFTFLTSAGDVQEVDPEQGQNFDSLLPLLHRPVVSFAASSEGDCVLKFADGTELRGQPHATYEAWESHATGTLEGASLLCAVGGGPPWK